MEKDVVEVPCWILLHIRMPNLRNYKYYSKACHSKCKHLCKMLGMLQCYALYAVVLYILKWHPNIRKSVLVHEVITLYNVYCTTLQPVKSEFHCRRSYDLRLEYWSWMIISILLCYWHLTWSPEIQSSFKTTCHCLGIFLTKSLTFGVCVMGFELFNCALWNNTLVRRPQKKITTLVPEAKIWLKFANFLGRINGDVSL